MSVSLETHLFSGNYRERTSLHRRGPCPDYRTALSAEVSAPLCSQGTHSTPELQLLQRPNSPLPRVSEPAGTLIHCDSNLPNLPLLSHQELEHINPGTTVGAKTSPSFCCLYMTLQGKASTQSGNEMGLSQTGQPPDSCEH